MIVSSDNHQEIITEISQRPRSRSKDSKLRVNMRIYREPSTEGTDWDVYQTAYGNECRTTILKADKPAWPIPKEYEYNY